MNAICERLTGTLRRELPDQTLILGQAHLRAVLAGYQEHYSTARPHQAPASASRTLAPLPASPQQTPAPLRSAENPS
jgi:putative transposase